MLAGLMSRWTIFFGVASEVFGNELQGDVPAKLEVLGFVDHAHTTASQLAEDAVMGNLLTDHKKTRRLRVLIAVMLGRSPTLVNCVMTGTKR